mgnify:CR=1 FL=1
MSCNKFITYYIPTQFSHREYKVRCGLTDPYGHEARCDDCSTTRPWYICEHGVDISETGVCIRCEI